jgi:fluoride exporter
LLTSSIWVAVGGAIGSLGRYWLGLGFAAWTDSRFPWATLLVNVTGSLLIGAVAGLTGPDGRLASSAFTREFLMVGICGGYTTFSAFSLQTLALAQAGDWTRAGANVIASVVLCLVAVWLGYLLAVKVAG